MVLYAIPMTGARILGYAAQIDVPHIIELTNQKRNDVGLPPLNHNSQLEQAARAKAQHMLEHNYWAHVAPDGTEPWYFFGNVGYSYRYAGENLARDFSSSSAAIDAWMASPSHRDNMLSGKYKEIGVAVVEGDLAGQDSTIIVQLFGTQLVDTIPQEPIAQAQAQVVPTAIPTAVPTVADISPIPTNIPTPSPQPTPEAAFVAQVAPPELPSDLAAADRNTFEILISPFNTTRNIAISLIVILMMVLTIDTIVVARRQVKRLGGRALAHMAFLGMILAVVIIARAGQIL